RVARYDYYGRGFSDRPNVRYTADLFDRQMLQLLDSLGWTGPVDIVGLSMGGPVTAEFTGRHPERVRSLTLADPGRGSRCHRWRPASSPISWSRRSGPTGRTAIASRCNTMVLAERCYPR